ncbi:MAG: CDP-glycerol glycerophosphotransferase family protein, partial [Gammaproteobacteria bacterium]
MSVVEFSGEIGKSLLAVFKGILGWLFIAPFAILMPRRRDWLVVIGRDEGKFVDNAKYFFLQSRSLLNDELRIVFVTERADVADLLAGTRCEVSVYPSWSSIWILLRSATVVVDSSEWILRFRRFLLCGASVLQLWHGVGNKRIELDKWRNEAKGRGLLSAGWTLPLRKVMHTLSGRLVRYDAVNTTSVFYRDNVFVPAFLSRHFLVSGYPRNAFNTIGNTGETPAWRNVDPAIGSLIPAWQVQNRRIVIVAPTFRDTQISPLGLDSDATLLLDDYCERHGVEFIFKFHPAERSANRIQGHHLHVCSPDSDLYPLLPLSSALITDYSSICMDYLLLDKPVLFLVPDLEDYMLHDRQLQFDPDEMTPGPKLSSWQEVIDTLDSLRQKDDYVEERARLRRIAFDDIPQEEAVPRLIG